MRPGDDSRPRRRRRPPDGPPTRFLARSDDNLAALSRRLSRPVSGDLGGDALRAWRVTFDLGKGQMFLE